ncbi:MAG: 50S ribosomal protein L6 [Dehalococcoidia bacterium]|nr:50S ribosomal protein L6 [Dehalococcoidia bacterium]
MSRIGRQPIPIPANVTVGIAGQTVEVRGPRGTLERELAAPIEPSLEDGHVIVRRASDVRQHRALHGLSRTLVANMVEGVTNGFKKTLELVGTGYRVQESGQSIVLQVGFSHPVELEPPPGIAFNVESATRFSVEGIDKELVGEIAARTRRIRPPEPYKGKGIRYAGEYVRRKPGKAARAAE